MKLSSKSLILIIAIFILILSQPISFPSDKSIKRTSGLLASELDYTITGQFAEDQVGKTLDIVGDINGDGYADLLIGAPGNDQTANDAGQSYLILGKSTDGWIRDQSVTLSDASFLGELADDSSGQSISGIGDVNNDGFNDFAIGAPLNDESATDAGQVYLIFGRQGNSWDFNTSLTLSNASFHGELAGDNAGHSISGVGDVNNDGYDDFVIGAHLNDESASDAGKVYLILGRATNQWLMDQSLSLSNASYTGERSLDQAGFAVSGVGDVNGDNFDDFIVGAIGYDQDSIFQRGKAYLIFGHSGTWTNGQSLSGVATSFVGETSGNQLGYALSEAGDANNDGYADFVLNAPFNDDGPGTDAGKSYLILGGETVWQGSNLVSVANASFIGEGSADQSGISSSTVGDLNSDGFDDFTIGAHLHDGLSGSDSGKVYILFGGSNLDGKSNFNLANANLSYIGENNAYTTGYVLSGRGDLNGDGRNDIVIGAPLSDRVASNTGEVYIILQPLEIVTEIESTTETSTVTKTRTETKTESTTETKESSTTINQTFTKRTTLISEKVITSNVTITRIISESGNLSTQPITSIFGLLLVIVMIRYKMKLK